MVPTVAHVNYRTSYSSATFLLQETEGRKILYFYPHDTDINIQKDYVGMTEGLIGFTTDFAKSAGAATPCEAVHTQKHRYSIFQPEKDHLLVMVVKLPVLVGKDGKEIEELQVRGCCQRRSATTPRLAGMLAQEPDVCKYFTADLFFTIMCVCVSGRVRASRRSWTTLCSRQ